MLTAADTDGSALTVNCSHVWFWGFEVTVGGAPVKERGDAVALRGGDGVKLINLVIHDNPNRSGIGGWDVGSDHEFYGCLVYRNGLGGKALAHGIYTQNTVGHTPKTVADCLFFNNFGFGVHCYGQAPELANFVFEGVAAFGNAQPL
jgi:hypothetical protein